jgi:Spy/CpxP family protein refolding chaperone
MAGDRACEIMPRRNAMKRRTMMVMFGVLGVGLLAGAAGLAFAHQGREGMMKRFVSSAIDDALAPAQPTPEQRAAIYAARDRAFAIVEEQRKGRRARIEEVLALFEAEPADPARIQAFRERAAADRERVREAISQAVVEAHHVLTPAQRKAVADYVRSHHGHHMP